MSQSKMPFKLVVCGALSVLSHCAFAGTGEDYDDAFGKAYQYLCRHDRVRKDAIAKFRSVMALDPKNARNIEAEYYIVRMLGGDCQPDEPVDESLFKKELERILHDYKTAEKTYWYKKLEITYWQMLANDKPEEAKKVFWRILRCDPATITVPETGRFWRTRDQAIQHLMTGASWALMHEETRLLRKKTPDGKDDLTDALAKAEVVAGELEKDPSARRWSRLARVWIQVAKADDLASVRLPSPQTQTAPTSEPAVETAFEHLKRRGRWDEVVSQIPSTINIAKDTPKPPKVELVGSETIERNSSDSGIGLMVAAAAMALAGIIVIWLAVRRKQSDTAKL